MVELLAGPERKKFLVHSNALESHGGRLMSCSADPSLVDWDEETVGRLIEYVYTDDYYCPDPVPLATPVATPEAIPGSEQGDRSEEQSIPELSQARRVREGEEKGEEKEEEKGEGEEKPEPTPPIRPLTPLPDCLPDGADPPEKQSAAHIFLDKYFNPIEHDYEDVLLAHAKIYALAREWTVEPLCTLAAQRLLGTLTSIRQVPPHSPGAATFAHSWELYRARTVYIRPYT